VLVCCEEQTTLGNQLRAQNAILTFIGIKELHEAGLATLYRQGSKIFAEGTLKVFECQRHL
jgi:hypothetical protein